MKKVLPIAMIFLAGCATVDDVRQTHSYDLCYRVATGQFAGLPASVFLETLASRGEDCTQYQAMIQTRLQAKAQNDAAISSGIMLLQAAQPKPSTIRPQSDVMCRAFPGSGGQVIARCY